jgi:hypothetical protein
MIAAATCQPQRRKSILVAAILIKVGEPARRCDDPDEFRGAF